MAWPARTICAVLDDMRASYKTYNFSNIGSLIEEVQMLANRMEARLDTEESYDNARDRLREVREELKDGKTELEKLKRELKLTNQIKELK